MTLQAILTVAVCVEATAIFLQAILSHALKERLEDLEADVEYLEVLAGVRQRER